MKAILLICITFFTSQVFSQCPTDAGSDRVVCSNYYGNATALTIGPSSYDNGLSFSWSPTNGLSNHTIANPTALPDSTTTYTLTVSGGGCGTYALTVTVNVAGIIKETTPYGAIKRAPVHLDVYYQYEGTDSVVLHSDDPNTLWCEYPNFYSNGNVPSATGSRFAYKFTGTGVKDSIYFVWTHDDNNNSCSYTDMPEIVTHGCDPDSDYPVGITHSFYTHSSCGPTLPATITQPSSMGSGTTYAWTLYGSNGAYWSISSPSGNSATLNNSGGTSYASEGISTMAYKSTGYYGYPGEIRLDWGVGIITNSNCTLSIKNDTSTAKANADNGNVKTMLYPNPAHGQVTASSANSIQTVQLFNASGVLIKTIKTDGGNSVSINVFDMKPGFYSCKLFTDNGVEVLKLIVE